MVTDFNKMSLVGTRETSLKRRLFGTRGCNIIGNVINYRPLNNPLASFAIRKYDSLKLSSRFKVKLLLPESAVLHSLGQRNEGTLPAL